MEKFLYLFIFIFLMKNYLLILNFNDSNLKLFHYLILIKSYSNFV